jgi:hypothetical protein
MSDQTTEALSRKVTIGRSKYFAHWLGRIAGLVVLAVSSSVGTFEALADCAVAPAGQIGWWRAEGNAADASGTNQGTLFGGVTFVAGKVGQAFNFDGTNAYVEVPDSPALRLTNELTIEFWVKRQRLFFPSLPYADYVVEKGGDYTGGALNYSVALHNQQYSNCLSLVFAGGWRGAGSVSDFNWHHCAVVARNGQPDPTFYIDGVEQPVVYREGAGTINLFPSTRPLHIGAQLDPVTGWFYFSQNILDELGLYNRALAASEIQAIYAAGSAGKCAATNPPPPCAPTPSGLVSWWSGQGNANDLIGANPGTLQNGVSFVPGEVDAAFNFDAGAYVRMGAAPSLTMSNSFSVELWLYPTGPGGAPGYGGILINKEGQYEIARFADGTIQWAVATPGNPVWTWVNSGFVAPAGQWTHLAWTYDFGTSRLFANGQLVQTVPGSGPVGSLEVYSPNEFWIGNRQDVSASQWFQGRLDEISIYNRALSATDIQAIYAAGTAGKCVVSNPPPPWLLAGPIKNVANGHWYYLLDATNWPAAEQIGVSLGGHLATINNAAENEWVFTNFSNFGGGDRALWIGLNDAGQENIWQWISGAPVTYFNWAPGEPNNGGGLFPSENHVLIWNPSSGFPPGSWNDAPSNQLHSAVIEVGPAEPVILGGPITNAANGHWYFLLNYTNWPAAEQIAVSLGGHLATINNAAENAWVFDTFSTFGGLERPMWIGLNDAAQEGTFVWVSGEPVTYLNWAPGEPNNGDGVFPSENHVLMWHPSSGFPLGSWNDAPSNQLQYAVVEVAPPAPYIILQLTNLTVYVGSNATFRVGAGGGAPLFYQWQFNGTNLDGRTSSVLTLANVQFSNAGPYSVTVSNAGGSVTSSPAILTVNPLPNCVPPPAGLVSWWRAENDTTDNWDSNNGSGFVQFGSGKVGRAFASPRLAVPDAASLRVTNGLTLEAWVNPSSVSPTTPATIVSRFDSPLPETPGANSSFYIGLTNSGRIIFSVSATGSVRTNTSLVTVQSVPINQWTHIAATYDGVHIRIYTNGTLSGAKDHFTGIFPGTATLGIGAIPSASPTAASFWPFNGLLDEISLYNRALTDGEIQAIYRADFVGKCLVAPSIVTHPQDQAIPLGEDMKFTVSVLGNRPLKYQWRFNGAVIAGATNSSLALEKVNTNQAGSYHVAVTNALGFAISMRAQLSLLPAPTCTEAPAGLISWWPGDGITADAMGANNVYAFSPPNYATGKVDRAFSFNGINSRIGVNYSASLEFGSNDDFSIEMWIKAGKSNTATANVPLFEQRIGTGSWIGYSLSLNQGRLAFAMGTSPQSATNVSAFTSPGPDLRDAMFHHVAVSVNRAATNGGNLYVDGQLVLRFDPTPRNGSLATSSEGRLFIGAPYIFTTNSYFGGLIDEPAIYNRALTAEEILAIRQAGAAGKCKTPPSILVQPVSQRVTVGSNVAFSVTAAGSPLLRYQWFHNGVTLGNVATNSAYSFIVQPGLPDTYSVRVTNLFGAITSSVAVLTPNNVPTAFGATVTLDEDTPTPIGLQGSDPENDPLTYNIVIPPAHGTLLGTLPNVTYLPSTNYNGPDSFAFTVNDGLVDSAPATVSLTILPVNDPPVALSQSVALDEDTTAAITLGAFDVENDPLTFTVGAPAHGTLTGTPPNLTYRPVTNYFGPDSFTFSVNDGQTNSGIATVSITVRPVNDPPVAEIVLAPLSHLPGITNLLIIAPVGTNAVVILDGSRSTDVENDPLEYFWSEGTNTFATGVLATNRFALGVHVITLIVSDGQATGTNLVVLEVLSPAQAAGTLTTLVETSNLSGKNANPLLASLRAAAAAFDRGNANAGINQLQAFQNKVQAQIAPLDPTLAATLIEGALEIIDVLSAPASSSATGNRLKNPTRLAGGKFQMHFNGPHGRTYFIEASTNLATWEIIGVARDAGQNLFDFEDVHAAQFPGRFYRVATPWP